VNSSCKRLRGTEACAGSLGSLTAAVAVRLAMETGCHTYKQRRLREDRPGDMIRNAEALMTQIAAVSGACRCSLTLAIALRSRCLQRRMLKA